MMNQLGLNEKLARIAIEFDANKKSVGTLKFSYFQAEDLKTIFSKLMLKYRVTFHATQKKLETERQEAYEKVFTLATVKFEYRLICLDTGETISYKWYGSSTDYGDGGRAVSKAVTSCFKSWLLTILMIGEKTPMNSTEFYSYLEGEGIEKADLKNGMAIIGRKILIKSELEIIFNEILAVKSIIKRFKIQNSGNGDYDRNRDSFFEVAEKTQYPTYKIAEYLIETNNSYLYSWPGPNGVDTELNKKTLDLHFNNDN